jgi:hypothetical protein
MGKRNKNDRDDWLKQDTGWPARQTIAHVMRLDKIMIWISIHLHALQRGERARERESERAVHSPLCSLFLFLILSLIPIFAHCIPSINIIRL